MGGNRLFAQGIGLLLHFVRPGVGQVEVGQGEGPFDARFTGLADNPQYLGLALAVLERVAMNLAVDEVVRLGVHTFFRRNENPAVDARRFRRNKVALALDQVTAHEGGQVRFQQLVHHALGFALFHFLFGNVYPVAGQHLLHFLGRQEHVPSFIQGHKAEAPVGGLDGTREDHLVLLDIGFQLAQLIESVGIEHGEITWLKMCDAAEYNGSARGSQIWQNRPGKIVRGAGVSCAR